MIDTVPGNGAGGDDGFTVLEHPPLPLGKTNLANNRWCDSGYFASLGIPILKGRTFSTSQRPGHSTEIVISNAFARQFFPHEDPIGKHMTTFNQTNSEIVGIVGNTRGNPAEPPQPIIYFPLAAGTDIVNSVTLAIRSQNDVTQFAMPVQRLLAGMDRNLSVSDVVTMDQLLGRNTLEASFDANLLLVFAGLSLLLAAVGLFGVLSYCRAVLNL